jgi:hypothetical protein
MDMKLKNHTLKNNINIVLILFTILFSCSQNKLKTKINRKIPTFIISFDYDNGYKFIAFDQKTDTLFIKNTFSNSDRVIGFKISNKLKQYLYEKIEYHLNPSYFLKLDENKTISQNNFDVRIRIGENTSSQLCVKIFNVRNYKEISSKFETIILKLKKEDILQSNW